MHEADEPTPEGSGVLRRFLRRHWRMALEVRDRLRMSEETFHLVMAGGVGILGGLTQFTYHLISQFLQILFLGRAGDTVEIFSHLPTYLRVITPLAGGIAAGLVLFFGFRILGSGGLSNLLEVIVAGDGRLNLRPALINALSSLLSLSSGASIGREGLIVQLVSTIASKLGQLAQWPPYRLRLLVACGAASGLSAGFNAPIAGAVFAAQIVLGNFAMNLFAPVVFASVTATMVSRSVIDIGQWYVIPTFHFTSLKQLPWFVVLGVISGLLGAGFLSLLRGSDALFSRLRWPIYARLGLAGGIVGLIAIRFPEACGNGYGATNEILSFTEDHGILMMVMGIFLAKLLATVVTVGSGTVGGVFTPTLFLGAALGSVQGALLHRLHLGADLPIGAFALVGMGSVLAATTHSPLLAMITAFELSLNYSLMPPLMLACVVSALISRRFHRDSVYTQTLRHREQETSTDTGRVGGATGQRVGDFMREPVPPVLEVTPLPALAERFLSGSNNFLPVVDSAGILIGVVALQDLKEHLHSGEELSGIIAADVMRPPPAFLTPDQKLSDVLTVLVSSELRNIPVVDTRNRRKLIGRIARTEVIDRMSEALNTTNLR